MNRALSTMVVALILASLAKGSAVVEPSLASSLAAQPMTHLANQITTASAGINAWTKLEINAGDIRSLAIDPQNPSILYAGTNGNGVFKSTNGGHAWFNTALMDADIRVLAINPQEPSTLYAGTQGKGVFKSTDGGISWTAVNAGLINTDVEALVIDPQNPRVLYVGTSGGVYKSIDSGTTWLQANNGLTTTAILALAIDPQNTNILYAGTNGGGIFETTDGGMNWSPINNGLTSTIVLSLAIDPQDSNIVYAGTVDGVFKSTNGGGNWMNSGLANTVVIALMVDPRHPNTIYASIIYWWIQQGNLFKSIDGGMNWSFIKAGIVHSLAINPQNSAIYIGTTSGNVFASADGGELWQLLDSGLNAGNITTQAFVIDRQDPSTFYVGTMGSGVFKCTNMGTHCSPRNYGMTNLNIRTIAINPATHSILYAGTSGSGIFKTTNGGISWNPINNGLTNLDITTIAIDPTAPAVIYAGTWGGGVFKSLDAGASWTPINNGLINLNIYTLAFDPITSTTLYVATSGGGVLKSVNGGASWEPINNGLTDYIVYTLVIDPLTPTTLYAGTSSSGVFKSTDGGVSWNPINNGLTNLSVSALAIDPMVPTTLYAGTQGGGVFKSTDGGSSWTPLNYGLYSNLIAVLAIQPVRPTISYAGTDWGTFVIRQGNWVTFDRVNYLAAPDNPELDVGDEEAESLTIEAWVYLEDRDSLTIANKPGAYSFYIEGREGGRCLYFKLEGTFVGSLGPRPDASMGVCVYGGWGFDTPGWHHFAAVFNKETGWMDLYADGRLEMRVFWESGSINNSPEPLIVGGRSNGGLAELRISAAARYSGGYVQLPGFICDDQTRALWPFDEPPGATTFQDICGVKNNLTNDETSPTGSLVINEGAAYTASPVVTLTLNATDTGTGVERMMVANSSDFSNTTWITYTSLLTWTLPAGDGTKAVYAKFRDRAGNISAVYSDTIILDTIPPTGSILIQGGAEVVTQTEVILTLSASDANGVTAMRLRNDLAAWGAWEPFTTTRIWTLPSQLGEHTVWVQFCDPAGNISEPYSDSVIYQFPHRVLLPLVMRYFNP